MAKAKGSNLSKLKAKKQSQEHLHVSFSTKNYSIIAFGILVIIIGYILMSEQSVDGFMPTVVAPIFLVIGYCIIIPIGIIYKNDPKDIGGFKFGAGKTSKEPVREADISADSDSSGSASSNIKTS